MIKFYTMPNGSKAMILPEIKVRSKKGAKRYGTNNGSYRQVMLEDGTICTISMDKLLKPH